jgi:hypothetical protein
VEEIRMRQAIRVLAVFGLMYFSGVSGQPAGYFGDCGASLICFSFCSSSVFLGVNLENSNEGSTVSLWG